MTATEIMRPRVLARQDREDFMSLLQDLSDEIATYFGPDARATVHVDIHRVTPPVAGRVLALRPGKTLGLGPTVDSRISVHCAQGGHVLSDADEHMLSETAYAILKGMDE